MTRAACVLGASIICVDFFVRLFPGRKKFRIQDSNTFLSGSLSLSSGVMVFSALYSMLPASKNYLKKTGMSPQAAAWTLIACFVGGAIGIQLISRYLHRFIASHVVDCDHTHDGAVHGEDEENGTNGADHHRRYHHDHGPRLKSAKKGKKSGLRRQDCERTRLLSSSADDEHSLNTIRWKALEDDSLISSKSSLQAQLTSRVSSLVSGAKAACGTRGPCYGYSDPCGQGCQKQMQSQSSVLQLPASDTKTPSSLGASTHPPHALARHNTAPLLRGTTSLSHEDFSSVAESSSSSSSTTTIPPVQSSHLSKSSPSYSPTHLTSHPTIDEATNICANTTTSMTSANSHNHHHHVPTNAFLSLSLQTSLAIALHKLPEGFITFATNHANPRLGFSIFMALFIHNITEGFALALPLYLALGSKWTAIVWSSLLGGASQPLGGAVAAVWFHFSGRVGAPDEGIYGAMFAITCMSSPYSSHPISSPSYSSPCSESGN